MRSFLFTAALFGGVLFTSSQARTSALAINYAPTYAAGAPYAAPFIFYAAASGALFACGTAAALAGIAREGLQ